MDILFIGRCLGLLMMVVGSVFFCYVPYGRLAVVREELENVTGTSIHYVDLLKFTLNLKTCKEALRSLWTGCSDEVQQTHRHDLLYENCQQLYGIVNHNCAEKLDIEQIDENSYVNYGCISESGQQLSILSINAGLINVTSINSRNLPGIIFKRCKIPPVV
ncbi:unnamed protein product [Thelazia callipaeda]|uniref:DUF19 domain-containing protein n=1 Tax=Thelazia callipaeda TaxID=103827 RepID=A0A0N5D6F7_THECL|nr:unnamed protein product [Thelazia callipaeda]